MSSALPYRPDVDGLRAISVSMVILYHAGLSLFPGGYIGVDLFFVISGYLITSIIYNELNVKKFSFRKFYKRRITRILPLFYAVTYISLIAAYFIFTPHDLINFADSLKYSAGFISNIYFFKLTGYFAPTAELLPLLHTWSLAIEEQFYIVWPLVLIFSYKFLPKQTFVFVFFVVTLSLVAYSEWAAVNRPSNAYYLLPARSAELMMGALLAIMQINNTLQKNLNWVNQLLATLGMVLILSSAFTLNKYSVFPGLNAMWACGGAALVIYAGTQTNTWVNQLLSLKPVVFIGLLSYSLYLWHWPILAYMKYLIMDFSSFYAYIAILVTLILSLISWKYIEQPLRKNHYKSFRHIFSFYFFAPLLITIYLMNVVEESRGLPDRLSKEVVDAANIVNSKFVPQAKNDANLERPDYFNGPLVGDVNNKHAQLNSVLWGDSHADHFLSLVDLLGKEYGFISGMVNINSCQPLLGTYRLRYGMIRPKCLATNERAKQAINADEIRNVFIAARWRMYSETSRNVGENAHPVYVGDDVSKEQTKENSRRVFRTGLFNTVAYIIERGKQPIILEQVPSYQYNPGNCYVKKLQYPNLYSSDCTTSFDEFKERQSFQRAVFDEIRSVYPQVKLMSYTNILCSDNKCISEINGIPLYRDNNHLNAKGSDLLAGYYHLQNKYDWLASIIK